MSVTVTMPQLGETVTEGTILSWAKQVGEQINEDEVLLEISTDKVDTEVPSPAAGTILEILVPEGTTVSVGTALAIIGEASERPAASPAAPAPAPVEEPPAAAAPAPTAAPAAPPAPAAPAPAAPAPEAPAPAAAAPAPAVPAPAAPAPPVPVPAGDADAPMRGVVSPVVRRIAAEHGLDLSGVPGTGEGGRITRKDVMGFIESGSAVAAPAATPEAPAPAAPVPVVPAPVAPAPAAPAEPAAVPVASAAAPPVPVPASVAVASAAAPPVPVPASVPVASAAAPVAAAPVAAASPISGVPVGPGDEVVEIPRLRRRIAENLVHAKRSTAHVWASVEVDYERVEQVRKRHRESFKAQEGFSLTYLPFIARATIDALAAYPVVNSSFYLEEGKQVFHGRANLGIAVDVEQKGLIVVTLRGADGLRLKGIARQIREMAGKARQGDLNPDDITGSTFSITNPGPFGSFMTAPVLNLPNVAILSTDAVTKRATVITDAAGADSIAIHHIGYLGLTWDHRAFDGSTAVLFLARIKENVETWDWESELT